MDEYPPALSKLTTISSSPERFLSWDRTGHCQFRPIKGTVKKSDHTRKEAYEILGSSKEQAENLMIVDLIRQYVSSLLIRTST
jgi:para-aminobenzoate synthetase